MNCQFIESIIYTDTVIDYKLPHYRRTLSLIKNFRRPFSQMSLTPPSDDDPLSLSMFYQSKSGAVSIVTGPLGLICLSDFDLH